MGKLSAEARKKKAGGKEAFSKQMSDLRKKGIKTKVDKNTELSPSV